MRAEEAKRKRRKEFIENHEYWADKFDDSFHPGNFWEVMAERGIPRELLEQFERRESARQILEGVRKSKRAKTQKKKLDAQRAGQPAKVRQKCGGRERPF